MKKGAKAAIIIGGAAAAAGIIYFITQKVGQGGGGQGSYFLQISTNTGGTTSPAPSPSGIVKPAGTVVAITATPNSGYTIGDVLVDGISIGTPTQFQVTMNMNHTVNVVFWLGGNPPVSAPVAITALGNAQVWGYYGAKVFTGVIRVDTCDQNWNYGATAFYQMQFKVIDSNGNGVPNIPVQLWPSLFPDTSKYQGYLILNYKMISKTNPLTLTTDQNGVVTVNLSYYYGLNDNLLRLCQDAELYLWYWWGLGVVPVTVHDGSVINGIVYSKGGHGITGQAPAAMGSLTANTVIAQIPNTSIPQAQGLAFCGFNIKML